MNPLAPLTAALAAALPHELTVHADELAALLTLPPPALAARLAARPVMAAALVSLVGRPLEVEGHALQIITGPVDTVQQITITGGFVERIIGHEIHVHLPPVPRVIDPVAAQELLAALPLETLAPVAPLPELHRMPFARNPHFVGRTNDMLALARALKGEGGTAALGSTAATTGLGGVGKTNLATEFAHRYGQFFAGGVFWLSFADPASIPLEVAACGLALDLPSFADLALDDQVQRVRSVWALPIPRLLIFDNCDATEPGQAEALIQQWRPPTGGCRVLITSRRGVWSTSLGVTTLPLGVLSRDESLALLRKHRPELAVDDPALAAIAAELGDLPLALHLAGSYLETYADSPAFGDPATFLSELRAARLLDHEALQGIDSTPSPTNHALHVARTFALSYERLLADDPTDAQALRLLARTAHLAPGNRVPRDLALATLGLAADDRLGQRHAERGLRELLSLGLIERDGSDGLRMHRLVGVYVRKVSHDPDAQADVEQVVIQLARNMVDAPTLAPLTTFLPVLRGVTDVALGREDEQAASLCAWLGRHLDRLGSYSLAQPYVERLLTISEHAVGADHPTTAASLGNLAALYHAQGQYEAALPLSVRALAIFEQALGMNHPTTATGLSNLAALYDEQGQYDTARPLYERALDISERVLGADHPDTATSLGNLAGLYQVQGQYDAARPLLERALAIHEHALGADHPDTITSLGNLAKLYRVQGQYAAALPLAARALAIREQTLGADHPDTALGLNNLAALYHAQGQDTAALPLYERALAITEQTLGANHPNTATSLDNLAALYDEQGQDDAAHPLYARALAIRERVLGPDHPDTALSLNNLAALYHAQGQDDAALPLYARALAIRERVLGPDHPDTALSLNNLAALYHAQGQDDAALPLYARALAIRERVLGPDHPDTALSLNNLAALYHAQGQDDAALPLYERALAISEHALGADHPTTAISLGNLAELYRVQGQYDAAHPLFERALAIREQALGIDHPTTAASLSSLAELYRVQGQDAAALPLLERALAIREQALGANHPITATSLYNLAINHFYQDNVQTAEQLMGRAHEIYEARLGTDHPNTQDSRQSLDAIRQRLSGTTHRPPTDPTAAFAHLLAAIAAVATGDEGPRQDVTAALAQLEQQGWRLRGPVERIWAGERDRAALVAGLDEQDTALIERVLALIEHRQARRSPLAWLRDLFRR
ncbi:tetratricopeptide repeat protein [Candidatus Chloroploca asiatica]|uniref:Uncharacterized protein n=1 Tax=Candidatus Chloroploca asiatica TaxID=1506545 RepID=A0A2H3L4Z3_9CHLR|nr:tetratricopeptide repeat protein [Candidatus Chloroploca asiatica]PDV97310.1 hypothetical protein A9Q02_18990 [Candidatus Chloroploca asiatica]